MTKEKNPKFIFEEGMIQDGNAFVRIVNGKKEKIPSNADQNELALSFIQKLDIFKYLKK